MPKVLCALVAAVLFAVVSTSQGYAATIPAAIGQSSAYIFAEAVGDFGVPSSATYITKDGTATASASVGVGASHPFISVSALTENNNPARYAIYGEAWEEYYMEIIGPSGWVPLNMQYSLSSYSSGNGDAIVNLGISGPYSWGGLSFSSCHKANCPGLTSITSTEKLTVPTNVLFTIGWNARAVAGTSDDYFGGTAQSQGDVYFYFDPGFADARNYSLVFSPNIVNEPISSVPLPAALPLFGSAALGLVAFAKRREKANLATAA